MVTFEEAITAGKITSDEALALFDSLPAVRIEEIQGLYEGKGFPTGNPQDGFLESSGWYGKRFDGYNTTHPLVFKGDGNEVFSVNPTKAFAFLKPGEAAKNSRDRLETKESHARLRMVEYRGIVTAGMIYNELPIIDLFRRVDQNTLLGVMDSVQLPGPPFFFVLKSTSKA